MVSYKPFYIVYFEFKEEEYRVEISEKEKKDVTICISKNGMVPFSVSLSVTPIEVSKMDVVKDSRVPAVGRSSSMLSLSTYNCSMS